MKLSPRVLATLAMLIGLGLMPVAAYLSAYPFLLVVMTRAVILAIAALSLDIILGLGGMISLGHAVYLGIGGYTVAIAAHHGQYSAWVQWPMALGLSAFFALVIGALCLRSRGMYFIMITLAFAQLFYFLAAGSQAYGGDDGLIIDRRSTLGAGIDLANKYTFYYVCFTCLVGCLFLAGRISNSRFGRILKAARLNEGRVNALGVPTFGYRLTAFVIAGSMCGLSGALLANHTDFVSPALLQWSQSGDLIVMVLLGGMGTLGGPVAGAIIFLMLEYVLSMVTEYWQMVLGIILVVMAIFKRGGLAALIPMGGRRG